MMLSASLPDRQAGVGRTEYLFHQPFRLVVCIDAFHRRAVDHHVRQFQRVQIEHSAHAVAVVLHHRTVAVQHVDRAAQFLVGRQGRGVLVEIDAHGAQTRRTIH